MTQQKQTKQTVQFVKSDREQIFDLLTALGGLGFLYYSTHPEQVQAAWEHVRAWGYAWMHRISVWEALQAIRSLPETDES
jgi:hypothetical protein